MKEEKRGGRGATPAGSERHRQPDSGIGSAGRNSRTDPGIRLLLADNHPAMMLGVRAVLEDTENIQVVGETASAEEVIGLARQLCPDLVILDPELEVVRGLETCRGLKSLPHPRRPRVLLYAAANSREDVASAALAGADAYVHKGLSIESIAEAVLQTHGGQRPWLLGTAEEDYPVELDAEVKKEKLTDREREVLWLVVTHYSNREISENLCLSINTAKRHVSSILKKLGVGNRRELFKRRRLLSDLRRPPDHK